MTPWFANFVVVCANRGNRGFGPSWAIGDALQSGSASARAPDFNLEMNAVGCSLVLPISWRGLVYSVNLAIAGNVGLRAKWKLHSIWFSLQLGQSGIRLKAVMTNWNQSGTVSNRETQTTLVMAAIWHNRASVTFGRPV